jgi:hypothetical protein
MVSVRPSRFKNSGVTPKMTGLGMVDFTFWEEPKHEGHKEHKVRKE